MFMRLVSHVTLTFVMVSACLAPSVLVAQPGDGIEFVVDGVEKQAASLIKEGDLSPIVQARAAWKATRKALAEAKLESAKQTKDRKSLRLAHLAMADLALEENNQIDAQSHLSAANSNIGENDHEIISGLAAFLETRLLLTQSKPREAELSLQENFPPIKRHFPEAGARLLFRAQVEAKDLPAAFATLRSNPSVFINKDGSRLEASNQLELVKQALNADLQNAQSKGVQEQANLLLKELARRHPLDAIASEAFSIARQLSDVDVAQALWTSPQARLQHGSKILQSLGPNGAHRSFAFELAGTKALQTDRVMEEKIAASLSASDSDQHDPALDKIIIDTVEWLMSVREYEEAFHRIEELYNRRSRLPIDLRAKVVFLAARCANATQNPTLALIRYEEVFTEHSASAFASDAKERYVKTLHYSQRHLDVVNALNRFGRSDKRFVRNHAWLNFWSLYLEARRLEVEKSPQSREYFEIAHRSLAKLKQESRKPGWNAKLTYWQGRLWEKIGEEAKAISEYQSLADWVEPSVYSVYSRWRMERLGTPVQEKSNQRIVSLAAKSDLNDRTSIQSDELQLDCGTEGAIVREMARAGLWDFARSVTRQLKVSKTSKEALLDCSRLAELSHDYNRSSSLARRALGSDWSRDKRPNWIKLSSFYPAKRLDYPAAFEEVVLPVAAQHELDSSLVYSIIRAESSYRPEVTSSVGARGLMQIMPQTGSRIADIIKFDEYHPDQLYEPKVNLALGIWYLRRLNDYYKNDLIRAVAAYNAGPVAVDRWADQIPYLDIDEFAENIPFDQTNGYVKKVLSYMDTYKRLSKSEEPGLVLRFGPDLTQPQKDLEVF